MLSGKRAAGDVSRVTVNFGDVDARRLGASAEGRGPFSRSLSFDAFVYREPTDPAGHSAGKEGGREGGSGCCFH